MVFKIGAAIIAYPIFFILYFFEALLFVGEGDWRVNLIWAPVRLLMSLVPPLIYVVLPSLIAWIFYINIIATNSFIIAIGSSIVIFGFVFFLTCFRVRSISHKHPGGYTLKPRERYQEVIKEAAVWSFGLLFTALWMCTISGIYTFIVKQKPKFENGKEYFLFACVSIWLELLFIWDLFLSVIIYLEVWRLPYMNREIGKLRN